MKIFTCSHCGREIISNHIRKYCSNECRNIHRDDWKLNYPIEKCLQCGNDYHKTGKRNFCSNECSSIYLIKKREDNRKARFILFSRDDFRCVYCGASPIENKNIILTLDHVEPYHINHNNSIYNLVTCCDKCNFEKNTIPLEPEVYARIIERNKMLNKGISEEQKEFSQAILHKHFEYSKN